MMKILRTGLLLAAAAFAALPASAAYPDKPVTLIVPFPPGGATDTIGRIIAKGMGRRLGQSVVIDNRAGAGTVIAAGAVAQAAPDGYTLQISSNTTFTVNPALKPKLPYDAQKSFESIGMIGGSTLVLLANPSLAANNLKELIALAKTKPGKIAYGSFGNGTTSHLAGEMLKVVAGIDLLHVPYKGSAPAMTDLIGGQVQLSIDTAIAAAPMLQAGKVKAIAVTAAKRSAALPKVPTVAEAGFPDYEMFSWVTIVAPRGLPAPVQQALAKALADTLADAAVRAELDKAGLEVTHQPGAAFDARVAKELPLLRAYVHKANIPYE